MPIDARWNTSYGIKFSNTPKNQPWQLFQGIASSPSILARQPYSTVSRNRDRIIPSARPYQPPSSSKSHGSEPTASGVASEEDPDVDTDEDIGDLHERASRQNGGKLGRGRLEFGQNTFNLQATTVLERCKNHADCCEPSRTIEKPLDCQTREWPSPNRQAVKARVDGPLNSWSTQKRALHCASLCSPDVTEELGGSLKSSSLSLDNACSPLGFRIADPAKSASQSSRDMKPLLWEYSLYRGPLGEKVKVHYCKSLADTERIARHFFDEEVIGFDIEWKSNASAKEGIKKNVALIQIASEERIALFHVARFRGEDTVGNLVPENFKYIMQSPRITKVGVSIKADCTRLRRFMGIESQGLFELSHLYKLVKYSPDDASSVNKRLVRLATQVEEHLGLPLWKGQDVRSSDWSADLNYEQVQCKPAWP